jgi:hypothetical protein
MSDAGARVGNREADALQWLHETAAELALGRTKSDDYHFMKAGLRAEGKIKIKINTTPTQPSP